MVQFQGHGSKVKVMAAKNGNMQLKNYWLEVATLMLEVIRSF